ncbi:alanine racemase [Salinimicrobium xinjiangense]|uniref:alanine racemase n=1 Tax=Salinimicrobium xinjiangense TaxID=438596 RepID=UPI000419F970|nr:alanine racemase [Salinimicrobium xinjiangense]
MLQITRPTLLLHEETCKANIRRMAEKALKHKVQLIPHFKTHQSARVGEWFREVGVTAITVTSVKMGTYFAEHGWRDITIAFPINVLEIAELNSLAARGDLRIFINSRETAGLLKQQLKNTVRFFIEVDAGDGRSGLGVRDLDKIGGILELTKNSQLKFDGFYTHPGHTYSAASPREVQKISSEVLEKLRSLKRHFREEFPELKIGLGDTPSCSIAEDFAGVDSIHPGNFVYYDLVQESIGANSFEEIAICLAVPVVAVHPERQEVIVHSGWVHQGKDSLTDRAGNSHYGLVVQLTNDKWSAPIPGAGVSKISQEHGVLSLPGEIMKQIKVGDLLGILPVHACATAVMMGEIWTTTGERLEMMPR